ncbi:response regulator [Hydrogenophaga sp. 2FB]|uniref:response regulator n=1 Tax=Hydrogenophaga sp. 2FB TaxID=2502187 RepID=UPI0010F766F6|nr:response regulator [Hydrogenophaga sp. 2FB]
MKTNSTRKPRVLCVDDEPVVLRMLQWLLEGQFDVSCTTDAREGRVRLRSDDFEVVISDQRMPGMLGTEFLQWARIESPNTMRLMLCGPPDFQAVLDAVNASEVFRFMSKPWDDQPLLHTVEYAAAVARSVPLRGAEPSVEQDDDSPFQQRRDEVVLLLDPDPAIEQQIRESLGTQAPMHWARNIDEANALIARHAVTVLLVETQVGEISTLDLIRRAKRSQPHAVSIAMSAERDCATVIRLINEAQIFRFLSKPLVHDQAHRMIQAALARHRELLAHPLRTARHAVQRSADGDLEFV